MKIINVKFFVATVCCFSSYAAYADNTANAVVNAGGDIITSLTLAVDDDIRFGEVAKDPINATSAIISVTDQSTGAFTVSYTANGSPDVSAAASGTGSIAAIAPNRSEIGPGKITVTGQPNYNYVATAAGAGFAAVVPFAGPAMFVETFTGSRVLAGGGTDSFYVGGTFSVPTHSVVQAYTGTIDITVTYD